MASIKFIISKIGSVNYGAFIKTAKKIGKQEGKPWPVVFLDILNCTRKYGAGHVDYDTFEMYKLDEKDRAKILTVSKNNELVRALNDPQDRLIFEDKAVFNGKFEPYIKRDWMVIDGKNYPEFEKLCKENDSLILKPLDESCGRGLEKIYPAKEKDLKNLYDRLYNQKILLVEETVTQCDEMNKLCKTSINTIRLVTILSKKGNANVVAGAIRMGREGSCVDNFNHGGLAVVLDVTKGESITNGYDKMRDQYETTESGTKLKGFKVPMWEECKQIVCDAAKVVPTVRYVAWDVCVSQDKGPLLIEGNSYPGQDVTQYPRLGLGTYEYFKKYMD